MVKRIDNNELDFDVQIKELTQVGRKNVIASVEDTKTQAEIEALNLRLQGKQAFIQNGLQGKYEVLASERKTETRKLDASFIEVGAGIYKAGKPAWDAGSLWTIYSTNTDGSIIVSRVEDEDEESRESLTASLQVRSSIRGRNSAPMIYLSAGDNIEFVDSKGRFASGTVLEVDHYARCYVVASDKSFEKEYVPFTLTASDSAFTSEDANADDDFQFVPESHSEEAYTNDSANADDEYSQNETDVSGFESMDEFDENFPLGGEDKVEASTKQAGSSFGDGDVPDFPIGAKVQHNDDGMTGTVTGYGDQWGEATVQVQWDDGEFTSEKESTAPVNMKVISGRLKNKIKKSANEQGLETGYDDVQTLDFMGDSLYDDVEQQSDSVGQVVEADFDFDFTGYDDGLDDFAQTPEDLQPAIDHYDFDSDLYAEASVEDGMDDLEQTTEDLQSENDAVDFGFNTADEWQDSVGEVVEAPEVDLSELNQVNRNQSASRKDLWLI